MATIAELETELERIQEEMKKPPHKRDGRVFRYRTAAQRVNDLEDKIRRKKESKRNDKRQSETRRKLILGAAYQFHLEQEGTPLKEALELHDWLGELGDDYPELFPAIFSVEPDPDVSKNRRLIILGGLVLRDHGPKNWQEYLSKILNPDDSDWGLFPEVEKLDSPSFAPES